MASYNEIFSGENPIVDTFVENNIKVHFVLLPGIVYPHTKVVKSSNDPSTCMGIQEAHESGTQMVHVGDYGQNVWHEAWFTHNSTI